MGKPRGLWGDEVNNACKVEGRGRGARSEFLKLQNGMQDLEMNDELPLK